MLLRIANVLNEEQLATVRASLERRTRHGWTAA